MRITFLSDNKTENPACVAEWGLSILIESCGHKVLFDTGASSIFAGNAASMGIRLDDVEAAVISHGHYDHTEGLPYFCMENDHARIYIHKNAISEAYGIDSSGMIEDDNCGIRWSNKFIENIRDRIVFTHDNFRINNSMILVGDIEPLKDYPMTDRFYRPVINREDKYIPDNMNHEQILIAEEETGIHIFSGCSHTGVMAAVERAKELFPGKNIRSLVAGMHLYPVEGKEKEKIVESLCSLGIDYIVPVHCSGMEAIMMFKEKLGDRCITASAGDIYEF